jgi:NDP-sugar pyrophosphorylase family protein
MESLRDFSDHQIVFACLDEHDLDLILRNTKAMGFQQITIAPRPRLSLGQAQTAYDVMSKVNPHEAIWIYNIDTFIKRGISPKDIDGYQGCVHVFHSTSPSMSFVRFSDDGQVVELAEKKVISDWATVGIYGFESSLLYQQLYESSYHDRQVQEVSGERYIAPMYQFLLNSGGKVCAPKLDHSAVSILGTPQEVVDFDSTVKPPFGSVVFK